MRCTTLVIIGALALAMLAGPLWAQTALTADAPKEKLQVEGEATITRPELQTLAGVKGWRVNGEEIPLSAVQELGVLYRGPYLLQDLVERKLLEQAAKRDGIAVTDAEVSEKVKALREEAGLMEDQTFARFLVTQQITPQGYVDAARTYVYIEKVIGKTVYVSDQEIEQVYNAGRETDYRRPELVAYRMAGSMDQKTAQAAVDEIKKGASFQEVAKRLVADPRQKVDAGELAVYARGTKQFQFPPDLENALFSAPLNQVVGPMQIAKQPYYLLFRVEKKTDAHQFTLAEARDAIRERIRRNKIKEAWPKWLQAQIATAEIAPLKAE